MPRRSPTARTLVLAAVALLVAGCARHATPEEVALEYGRAVYANDPQAIYRLLSGEDRRVKDEFPAAAR